MNQSGLVQIPRPFVLIILDGLGVAPASKGNAVTLAQPRYLEYYWQNFPHCYLNASGNSVGLPSGVVGNSEVGHMSIGSGKVIFQEIARIDKEIEEKVYLNNNILLEAANHVKQNNGKLHIMGLLSEGKVHSSLNHTIACLEFARNAGIKGDKVFIHVFTDGRDTSPQSAAKYIDKIEKACKQYKVGKVASIIGRYFAMDRDNRWDRTQKAYDLIVSGKGNQFEKWQQGLEASYKQSKTDEFIEPIVITRKETPLTTVTPGDAIIFFNYRADRAVQITKAFENDNFEGWQRQKIENIYFAGFSNYEKGIPMTRAKEDIAHHGDESAMVKNLFAQELTKSAEGFPVHQVFPPERVEYSLGRVISDSGLKQLRITESEKFPHVTYFFNCRKKDPFPGEDRIEIASPKDVKTYDQKPQMSAYEVTNNLIQKITSNLYDFIVVNYASTDMVPHTGVLNASVNAVKAVDECIGQLVNVILQKGGAAILTADHGNAEELINMQTGKVDTEHSTNPVSFIYIRQGYKPKELSFGILADIAPTILDTLRLKKPETMTGRNLLS